MFRFEAKQNFLDAKRNDTKRKIPKIPKILYRKYHQNSVNIFYRMDLKKLVWLRQKNEQWTLKNGQTAYVGGGGVANME